MPRYASKPANGNRETGHGWYANEPMIPDVSVPETVAVKTGLLDAKGDEIWRQPNPLGFGRDEEWG